MSTLSVDLTVSYRSGKRALQNVRFELAAGETLGVIGRSGSGKSTLAMALLGLLDRRFASTSGSIRLGELDLLRLRERQLRRVRGREIGLVLQAASSALNPYLRLGDQFHEAWRAHSSADWRHARADILRMLRDLDLDCDEGFLRRYPAEISIGQAQRVLIAMAVLHRPSVLLADEPISALDPVAAREVLDLLQRLNQQMDMSVIYISHDLASVAHLCDRVLILEGGVVVEQGPTATVFSDPQTADVRRLIGAIRALSPADSMYQQV